jgi:hypothetical protein
MGLFWNRVGEFSPMARRPVLAAYLAGLVAFILVAWAVLSSLWQIVGWLAGWKD